MMLKHIEVEKIDSSHPNSPMQGGGGVFAQTGGGNCQFKYFGEHNDSKMNEEVLLRSGKENKIEESIQMETSFNVTSPAVVENQ